MDSRRQDGSHGDTQVQEAPVQPLSPTELRRQRLIIAGLALGGLVLIAALIAAVFFLLQPGTPTSTIRDVFIILIALEFMVIGLALIVLLIQLARLINLLQNEVRPILDSTNEAVNTLRGTAAFLSDNVVEPVVKVNGYLAMVRRALKLLRIGR